MILTIVSFYDKIEKNFFVFDSLDKINGTFKNSLLYKLS